MQSRGAECDDAAALTCNHEARGCRLITAPSLSQEGAKPQLREPLPLSLNSIHLDLDSEQTEQTRGSRAGCAKLAITMMGMWGPNPGGLGGNLGVAPMMASASALPGIPCAGCGAVPAVPAVPVPGAGMSLPAINEGVHCGQRHYMGQIVMGMKTSNLFQVAQNLEAAVNSQVPIPQEFLATVHLWMKSRAQSESGLSQMQLAQFIGASSFNNQVQANVQMLAQTPPAPTSPPPPPPASPPPASPPASPPLAGSPLPASAPLPASPMFIPSPPLPTSPMYVESPLMGGARDSRDLRRPAEPSQGPKGARDLRPAEPTKPPGREVRDSRRPAEPDLPPRRRHPLPPPPSTSFGSAGSSSYLGSAHIALCGLV
eukprot:s4670_g6.t1